MGRPKLFTEPLVGGCIFHVYNQTNNKEVMFKNDQDRWKFLKRLEKFIAPFAYLLSYSLMSNHFHLVIEVFDKEYFLRHTGKHFIEDLPPVCKRLVLEDEENMPLIMSNRFSSMFKGYATSHNYRHNRNGNFFHRPFCRKLIDSELYFKKATHYVHANAVRHNVVDSILDYNWTSYHCVAQKDSSLIRLDRLFERFGGEESLLKYHKERLDTSDEEKYVIEEKDVFAAMKEKKKDVNIEG